MAEDEEGLGVLLYGYDTEQARFIGEFLNSMTGSEIQIIGGSSKEDVVVGQILEAGGETMFEEAEPKILMFLGFDDEIIGAVLGSFPRDLPRPIFCGLTENNVNWPLSELIEHLLEEQRHWSEKGHGRN